MKRVRKITAGLLLVIMTVLAAVPAASFADTAPDHIIINQIYGGGGKGDTPFTASFIELYNPTDNEISLNGYKLTYSSNRENSQGKHAGSTWMTDGSAEIKELNLSGNEIPSKSSFLIKCAEETTTVAVVEINNADISWNQVIDNDQSVEIIIYKESEKVDGISTRTSGFESIGEGDNPATTDISKQKSLRRTNFVDTDNNSADFKLLTWKDLAEDTKDQFIADYAPRSTSSGAWTEDLNSGGTTEPAYTPAVTGDVPVEGFYNDSASIKLQLTERYNSGAMNADGGSLEIVDYNPVNGFAYAVSGVKGKLIAVNTR